ncbi:MAG: hypothetical protein NTU95_02820 [Methanothrix sp.]|nr:hypothetical protein [Methanothrix sp.]
MACRSADVGMCMPPARREHWGMIVFVVGQPQRVPGTGTAEKWLL